jgi:5-methylcytosine-specific restriction enzyme subunit McrC
VRKDITVREYARLTTEPIQPTLDRAQVSQTAFDWLCELSASYSKAGAALVQIEGRRWLKLDNYVGIVETPCGTRLEILPKHFDEGDCLKRNRDLLITMICAALDLPTREAGATDIQATDSPLSEWVIQQFLQAVDLLVKRGVRSDYRRVEEETRFMRGQLDVARQMRQPPGRQHHFQTRYDVLSPDRAENRLLKSALERICKVTQTADNWRLAHELRSLFGDVQPSRDVQEDFKKWRHDRLMAHYIPVRPWCELVLNQQVPLAVAGDWHGISLLFPMEKLFERYVERCLYRALERGSQLRSQVASQFLCEHDGGRIFRLEPDLLIHNDAKHWVLDTKWKRLNALDKKSKYGLSQSDFYQLFAYGQKYLDGKGDLILIYPLRMTFTEPLPVFEYSPQLSLWVLPFDLERGRLVGAERTGLPLDYPINAFANHS